MILAVDGIDGSGKTTLLDNLEKLISDRMPGKRVLRLKALGSGPMGELIRNRVLNTEGYNPEHDNLYMAMAIIELFQYHIPKIKDDYDYILIDRYIGSYYAYQVNKEEDVVSRKNIMADRIFHNYLSNAGITDWPLDLYVYLKVSPDVSVNRLLEREGSDNQDRFDNIGDKMTLLDGFKEYHKNNLFRTSLMLNGNEAADVLAELVFKLL